MEAYVIGGWGAAVVVLTAYSWRVLHRGRALARALPDDSLPDASVPGEGAWR